MIDLITIVHNDTNKKLAERLDEQLHKYEPERYRLIVHDNSVINLGFAKGCNAGFKHATTEIVGFINPDITVHGKFIDVVQETFDRNPLAVIVGSAFGTPPSSYNHIGLRSWVCGAAFFVRSDWFERQGGFYEAYEWSWEETDLCRQAQEQGKEIIQIDAKLPFIHDQTPNEEQSEKDLEYKTLHFARGKRIYRRRWRHRG